MQNGANLWRIPLVLRRVGVDGECMKPLPIEAVRIVEGTNPDKARFVLPYCKDISVG